MERLDRDKTTFGRHQTFPLRFSWPTKGFAHWCEGHDIFNHDDPTIALGVGKNMVTSIRYWLEAAQIIKSHGISIEPTDLGNTLLSPSRGYDRYLEDDNSVWLLHWNIASNARFATSFFWFFNHFHKPEFTTREVVAALTEYLRDKLSIGVASNTIESDVSVLTRMYGPAIEDRSTPLEETLQSPMSALGLLDLSTDGKRITSKTGVRHELPLPAFGYAVLDLLECLNETSIPIKRLHVAEEHLAAPGSVFRLSEEGLVAKLEELTQWRPDIFEVRETAGLHQVYKLSEIQKNQLLIDYFMTTHNSEKSA